MYDYLILLAFFFLDPDVEHVHAVFQADAAVLFPAGRQSCSETTPAPTSNNKKHQRCDVTRIITNLDTPIHTLALSRVVPVWCPCGARVVSVWCLCGLA